MAYFNPEYSVIEGLSEEIGKEFETNFINIFQSKYKNNQFTNITDCRGTENDKEQGTDFIINDIHTDTTLDFSNKDNMPFIYDTKIEAIPNQTFKIGIRHGNMYKNKYHGFKHAVIVIGCDIPPNDYRMYEDIFYDNLKKHFNEIINEIEIVNEDYTQKDLQERQFLDLEHKLKPNPNYIRPKNLEKRYADLEQLQIQLNQQSEQEEEFS